MARAALPCDGLLTSGVRKGRDVLAESLMALAALAGNTVVTAATTDAWEAARRGFARLLGRGDPQRTAVAERRLGQTHEQLTGVTGADLESAQAALEAQWVTRLADLLEEDRQYALKKLELDEAAFAEIMGAPRRTFLDYRTSHRLFELAKKVVNSSRQLIG